LRALSHDARYAIRSLAKRPAFSLVAVATLALGIGATTAIYSVVNAVLLRPLPYASSERIVVIREHLMGEPVASAVGFISTPNFDDVGSASTSFEAMAQYRSANITLAGGAAAELHTGAEVGADFFRVFSAEPMVGRAFTAEEARLGGPKVAVVSHGFWLERMGGDAGAIGSTLQLQGTTAEVVGVAPPGFDFPNGARIWLPIQYAEDRCGRGCQQFAGLGLLRTEVSPERARTEVTAIADRLRAEYPTQNAGTTLLLDTLHDVTVGDVRTALYVVTAAVVMLLLIACANVANLLLVRGTTRREEMAVRAVLGAGRGRLATQLITESALLATCGAIAGVLIAVWGVEVLRDIAPDTLPRVDEIALDGTAVLFAILVSATTVAIFGIAPALQLSAAPFAQTLREAGRGGTGGRHKSRSLILAVEVALSVCLLLGAGLMLRSLVRMNRVEPGFTADGVTQFRIGLPGASYDPARGVAFIERARTELAALPGVEEVGFAVGLPLSGLHIYGGFERTDRPEPAPGEGPTATYGAFDPGYLPAMRIELLAGRNFAAGDRAGSQPVAIVNRTLADRYFPGEDPIGRQIELKVSVGFAEGTPRTIVGVIEDVHAQSLTIVPEPTMYVPEAQAGARFGHFVVRSTRPPEEIVRAAREVVTRLDAQVPLVRPGAMSELLAADTARHEFYLTLIGLFAAVALTLSAVGMYGVVAFVVEQRTREIGLRMALGARARQIVSLVVWQGLRPTLLGAAAGVVGALAAGRVLAGLLFEVSTADPLTLVGVTAVLLGVVALACTLPARRAARVPPGIALRAE
jgi:putative ABC transport system permease protein